MMHTYGFYFAQPLWLIALVLLAPIIWLGVRNMSALSRLRYITALILRCLVVIVLVFLLARPMLTQKSKAATTIVVLDRSLSVPTVLQIASLDYLKVALSDKDPHELLGIVDVAEAAYISKLPSGDREIPQRNTSLSGQESKLSDGIQMALAIAPPDSALRVLLVSEGNETAGDLKEAARTVAGMGIPIDVLPLRYQYDREVVFQRLAVQGRARIGQTVSLRFVLKSTADASGKLLLSLNGRTIDLDPDTPEVMAGLNLKPGTNVKTVSIPIVSAGIHEFSAEFIPDEPTQDQIKENNRANAMMIVAGPGHILLVDADGVEAQSLVRVLQSTDMDVRYSIAAEFPDSLVQLMDSDAVILVNTDCSHFTYQQQEIIRRYVTDLGGGLLMVGGADSFGAGGWIDSPVAEIVPVDMDPPQKKQMPRGALVLVIDRSGSMSGEKVEICKVAAAAAVRSLSRLDMVGIVVFNAGNDWLAPLSPAGNKERIFQRIRSIGAGGGTVMGPAMQLAFEALKFAKAGIKHVVLLTDGQTSDRDYCAQLGLEMAKSDITISTVGVGEGADIELLSSIAMVAKGRFHHVIDPSRIPEIFVKEAQVVRRSMIIEETFTPQISYSLSEVLGGLSAALPNLDGYIFTGPKGGLNQVVLSSHQSDPILATCQAGLGRCVAFTSSIDSRWAANWLGWGGFARFWEQTIRWVAKPGQSSECEVFADIQGRDVTINVEAVDVEGKFTSFASIEGQVISPDVSTEPLQLNQTGPGQYKGRFQGTGSGSYIVTLHTRKPGADAKTEVTYTTVTIPFAPEFQDLSDNAGLLEEVSKITGGRILVSNPNEAHLYDRAGLKFPETQLPLIRPLMFLWLMMFLLDVAVRRVVVDFRAIGRRIVGLAGSLRGQTKSDQTLERLQASRRKVQEKLSARKADITASRRYRPKEEFTGDLPMADMEPPKEPVRPAEKEKAAPARMSRDQEQSHIDRLLKAKRKAAEGGTGGKDQGNV